MAPAKKVVKKVAPKKVVKVEKTVEVVEKTPAVCSNCEGSGRFCSVCSSHVVV